MTRQLTINLPEDVYLFLEIRAAIDDLRISEGVECLLVELAHKKMRKGSV